MKIDQEKYEIELTPAEFFTAWYDPNTSTLPKTLVDACENELYINMFHVGDNRELTCTDWLYLDIPDENIAKVVVSVFHYELEKILKEMKESQLKD